VEEWRHELPGRSPEAIRWQVRRYQESADAPDPQE
jgi:hypothetical protein